MAIELQDFAKQVLFGTTIEEKLSFPREEIVDTRPGDPIKTPSRLTRPPQLALREDGVRADHPSVAKLIDEKERGQLLHFFGNHELLATELMALAILKFPDAPASFRRGLLETLKDEQIHTRIYMHRMKQCGVEFGELPLSDYFWKSVSSMEDPLDYVTRLSLTFEQANLDYSREYGKIFASVGDDATAGILDRIYRDEIGHVGFGLKWFRRWKAAGKTDWEAYQERLSFPLSPARAKGNDYNAEGRRAVGFDAAFIDELQVYSQSRGRTPCVYWFNPDAEQCAARDSSEAVGDGASILQEDLGLLPAFLARKDDVLVTPNRVSIDHLRRLQSCGFALPEIAPSVERAGRQVAPSLNRKIASIRPWGWSPDAVAYFREELAAVTRPVEVDTLWNQGIRSLYSKRWSAEWGRELAGDIVGRDWLAPAEVYGAPARNAEELADLRGHFASIGYPDIVCKAPFGTAASGNRCVLEREGLTPAIQAWLESVWSEQGTVIVEPWLPRVCDFSVQLEMRDGRLDTVAFTRLINNARGQFVGIVCNAFASGLDVEVARFLMQRESGKPRVYRWYEDTVAPRLAERLARTTFQGPLGIDAFVFRDRDGGLKLKTVVEINPRFTMGRVAHELYLRCSPRGVGLFQILTLSQIRKRGFPDFASFGADLGRANPARMTDERSPRLLSGSVALTDPATAKRYLAVYHARERFDALPL